MSTVYDALVAIAGRLPGAVRGVATNGGEENDNVYIVDTYRLPNFENDTFNGGVLFILTGDAAGAMMPIVEKEGVDTSRVDGDEGVIWSQSGSEVPAAGDFYLVVPNSWNAVLLISALDEALRSWGKVGTLTSLGTGDGETTTWTVSSGEVVRVYKTNDDDNLRVELFLWEPVSGGVELQDVVEDGYTVTALIADSAGSYSSLGLTGTIPSDIPIEYLGWYGAYACLRQKVGMQGHDTETNAGLMNHAADMAMAERARSGAVGVESRERLMA